MPKIRGYLLPDNIDNYTPEDTVCVTFNIPNDRQYRAALLGQLHELGKWWAWEHGQHGDTRARDAAQFWRDTVLDSITIDDESCHDCDDEDENEDAPYWSEADAMSAAGSGNNWEYIGDWLVTGFLVAAGSPAAALVYRTLVRTARIAFQTQDLGMIADVFIDGILAMSIPTVSAVSGVSEIIEANIDLVQFAVDNGLASGVERIIRIVPRAA